MALTPRLSNNHLAELLALWRDHFGLRRVIDPNRRRLFEELAAHRLVALDEIPHPARREARPALEVRITVAGRLELDRWRRGAVQVAWPPAARGARAP